MKAVPGLAMSMVGKLLEEVSWEHATSYRQGGRGRENVLSAEVMMALDFLPRDRFLGAAIRAANGADHARNVLINEIEEAELRFLPGDMMSKAAEELLSHFEAKEIDDSPPPPSGKVAPTRDVPIIAERLDENSVDRRPLGHGGSFRVGGRAFEGAESAAHRLVEWKLPAVVMQKGPRMPSGHSATAFEATATWRHISTKLAGGTPGAR